MQIPITVNDVDPMILSCTVSVLLPI